MFVNKTIWNVVVISAAVGSTECCTRDRGEQNFMGTHTHVQILLKWHSDVSFEMDTVLIVTATLKYLSSGSYLEFSTHITNSWRHMRKYLLAFLNCFCQVGDMTFWHHLATSVMLHGLTCISADGTVQFFKLHALRCLLTVKKSHSFGYIRNIQCHSIGHFYARYWRKLQNA